MPADMKRAVGVEIISSELLEVEKAYKGNIFREEFLLM